MKKSGFRFRLDDFAAPIEASRADVVTQMSFASGCLNRDTWHNQRIVGTMHTAFGR